MIFLQILLNVLATVYLLEHPVSTVAHVPQPSLWGKKADLTACTNWTLSPHVVIPTLRAFTTCLKLQLQDWPRSPWVAFVYHIKGAQHIELSLGGENENLTVWLLGTKWETSIHLSPNQWHSLCLTWSGPKKEPALYVNETLMNLTADATLDTCPSCHKLTSNGTLTLGGDCRGVEAPVGHPSKNNPLKGNLSLFRLWQQERSQEEVMSLYCTEGDIVKWKQDIWNTHTYAPLPDESLLCVWSDYEVTLMCNISASELNTAKDIAHRWLTEVLPHNFSLHRVEVVRAPRFNCMVYLTVVPGKDVVAVQNLIQKRLSSSYTHESSCLQPITNTIQTTPVKHPENISDLYFEVEANVSITGGRDPEQILLTWINTTLTRGQMAMLDFQLLPKPDRHNIQHSNGKEQGESGDSGLQASSSDGHGGSSQQVASCDIYREWCVFQVFVPLPSHDPQEIEKQIKTLLKKPYNNQNATVSVKDQDMQISRILKLNCNAEHQQTKKGLFDWPSTFGGKNTTCPCPKNPSHYATRKCKMCLNTHWMEPDLDDCLLMVQTISDLDDIEVTTENAKDVADVIESLLSEESTLSYQELSTVLNKLKDIIHVTTVTPNLGQAIINIISKILESNSDFTPFTNMILNITEEMGDTMVGYQLSSTLVAPAVAVSVVDANQEAFGVLTFGVSSDRTGLNPQIFINRFPFNSPVAFIALPASLQYSVTQYSPSQSTSRIQFQFYGIPTLFQSNQKGQTLSTFVVSASVTNATSPIKDLQEEVKVMLHHLKPNPHPQNAECVYWNFNKNNGRGGWDGHGCRKFNSTSEYTTCLCNHLTHFGVLLDVSRTELDPLNEQILTIITYIGCGISALCLGVTVLTYTAFKKLRRDYPSQILINLSLALLGLNLVFLVNSWLSSWGVYGLCVAVACMLHYFLLASFTWMGLEAVNMYFALVKVFNIYVPSYIFKFCLLGWGIPLLICVLVLIVNREAYGSQLYRGTQLSMELLDTSANFCWLQDDVTFYVSVVAYGALVFLLNTAIFVVVVIQIRRMRVNSPVGIRSGVLHDLKGIVSLTLLLGLTWTVGFFTWTPARIVLLYLFSGLNTLQGLFIFFFHCLMKENVRKQWQIHLCFGRFRLEEYSDWSNSGSVAVLAKARSNAPKATIPSVRSVKSSSTDSTSASSDSSQRESFYSRPNLGLFMNGVALPRAHATSEMKPTPGWRNHSPGQQGDR